MANPLREYTSEAYIGHIFVTIDPSATRERSDYVVTSMFYIKEPGQDMPLCVVCLLINEHPFSSCMIYNIVECRHTIKKFNNFTFITIYKPMSSIYM